MWRSQHHLGRGKTKILGNIVLCPGKLSYKVVELLDRDARRVQVVVPVDIGWRWKVHLACAVALGDAIEDGQQGLGGDERRVTDTRKGRFGQKVLPVPISIGWLHVEKTNDMQLQVQRHGR